MVMRFMGGGVGHKATNAFTQAFAHEAWKFSMNPVIDDPLDDELGQNEGWEEVADAEEEDYGYVIDSEGEELDEDDEEDENLRGEDGEESWEMDNVQAEGFDDL
jgi:hypothetical protein